MLPFHSFTWLSSITVINTRAINRFGAMPLTSDKGREQKPASRPLQQAPCGLRLGPHPGAALTEKPAGRGRQLPRGHPPLRFSNALSCFHPSPGRFSQPGTYPPPPASRSELPFPPTPFRSPWGGHTSCRRRSRGSPVLMCRLAGDTALFYCHNGLPRLYTILEIRRASLLIGVTCPS